MTTPSRPADQPAGDLKLSPEYRALLGSDRVNNRLWKALVERSRPAASGDAPHLFEPGERAVLRVLVAHVLPQDAAGPDLALRIEARLATGRGNGWRFARLPPDAEAYRMALRSLDHAALGRFGRRVVDLAGEEVDALLRSVEDGTVGAVPADGLPPDALRHWFEDLRADAVRLYMALPSTLDRIGFSGVAAGGDGPVLPGFGHFGLGIEEPWEPQAYGRERRS